MTWIKVDSHLYERQEVWEIANRHRIDPDAVIGKVVRIWGWFDAHTKDGTASSIAKEILNNRVNVSNFCQSMIAIGWMIELDGTISLPHFNDPTVSGGRVRLIKIPEQANE